MQLFAEENHILVYRCASECMYVCRQLEFSLIDRFMCIDSQIKKFCTVSRQCYSCTHTDDAKNREN